MILIEDFDGGIFKYTNEQYHKDIYLARRLYKKKSWWINEKLHKIDEPAIVDLSFWGGIGYKQWFMNGNCHRIDGPAYESAGRIKSWRIKGIPINTISDLFCYLATTNKSRIA